AQPRRGPAAGTHRSESAREKGGSDSRGECVPEPPAMTNAHATIYDKDMRRAFTRTHPHISGACYSSMTRCQAVDATRAKPAAVYTTAQLKTIQEVITLLVFAGFSLVYLKEPLTWFALIAMGAFFVLRGPL